MSAGGRSLFTNLTTSINDGDMIALMGPSGSGKSTLLAGIAGLLPYDAGDVRFHEDIDASDIHWIFQTTSLLPRRTAADNVALVAELRGVPRIQALEYAHALLEELGLMQCANTRAYRLSGGEKQRVAIARALAAHARIILADEPTAALDPHSRSVVVTSLQRAAAAGAAVIVATHDQWVAEHCHSIVDLGTR